MTDNATMTESEALILKGSIITDFIEYNKLIPADTVWSDDAQSKLGVLVDELMFQAVRQNRPKPFVKKGDSDEA